MNVRNKNSLDAKDAVFYLKKVITVFKKCVKYNKMLTFSHDM